MSEERSFSLSDPAAKLPATNSTAPAEKDDTVLARSDDVSSMAVTPTRKSSQNKKEILRSFKKLDNIDFKKLVEEQKAQQQEQQNKLSNARSFESLRGRVCMSEDEAEPEHKEGNDEEEKEDDEEDIRGGTVRSPTAKKSLGRAGSAGSLSRGSLRKTKSDGTSIDKGQSLKMLQYHTMSEFADLKTIDRERRRNAYQALSNVRISLYPPRSYLFPLQQITRYYYSYLLVY